MPMDVNTVEELRSLDSGHDAHSDEELFMTVIVEDREVNELNRIWTTSHALTEGAPVNEPAIFAHMLLESSGTEKKRRGVSAILSLSLQCLLLATLLVVPLLLTQELPRQELLTMLVAPAPPPPPPAAAAAPRVVRHVQSDIINGELRTPTRIPAKIRMLKEDQAPPSLGTTAGVEGGIPGGQLGGVIGGIVNATTNIASVPKLATPVVRKPIRISSGVTAGLLLRKVAPRYPQIARQAHVSGQVVLAAIISKTGEIENLTVVSGHPMLAPAAIDAVKQWRYKPYLLNGEAVEVESNVIVTFDIS